MTKLPEGMPELPPPTLETNGVGHVNAKCHADDAMRAYGLACYQAALERAAALCEPQVAQIPDRGQRPERFTSDSTDVWISGGFISNQRTPSEIAAAIRALFNVTRENAD